MTNYKLIPIHLLEEHPDNPRKTFEELALQELAASIKSMGVLQPCLVRRHEKVYQIICGARRYRASKLAGLDKVPCNITQLEDEKVFEVMITENLQREDVDPIEEAEAFKWLRDNKNYNVDEIAERFGRSKNFVYGRLHLSDLIPAFRQMVTEQKITIKDAKKLAVFTPEIQELQLLERVTEAIDAGWHNDPVSDIIEDVFNEQNLNHAFFDLGDIEKPGGPCTSCPKNTACSNFLFPEMAEKATCTDQICFTKNIDYKIRQAVDLAKNSADGFKIIFSAYYSDVTEAIERLPKEDKEFFMSTHETRNIIYEPTPDSKEEKEQWVEAVEDINFYPGYCFIRWRKPGLCFFRPFSENKTSAFDSNGNELTGEEAEVVRLREKQRRSRELDDNKVFQKTMEAIIDSDYREKTRFLGLVEMFSIAHKLEAEFVKEYNENSEYDLNPGEITEEFIEGLGTEKVSDYLITTLRRFLLKTYYTTVHTSHKTHTIQKCIYLVTKKFMPDSVQKIEEDQQEKAESRDKRIEQRIKDILLSIKSETSNDKSRV